MRDPRAAYNKEWRRTHPGMVRAQRKRSYAKNAEKRRSYSRQRYHAKIEECKKAQKTWRDAHREHRRKYQSGWYSKNREQQITYHRERNRSIKKEVLSFYGDFCSCCGERDWEFLTIDHINGGGTKHRDTQKLFGTQFYFWLKKQGFPPGYRTLCFNCNCVLGAYGYCPHRVGPDRMRYEQKVEEMKLAAIAKGVKR